MLGSLQLCSANTVSPGYHGAKASEQTQPRTSSNVFFNASVGLATDCDGVSMAAGVASTGAGAGAATGAGAGAAALAFCAGLAISEARRLAFPDGSCAGFDGAGAGGTAAVWV